MNIIYDSYHEGDEFREKCIEFLELHIDRDFEKEPLREEEIQRRMNEKDQNDWDDNVMQLVKYMSGQTVVMIASIKKWSEKFTGELVGDFGEIFEKFVENCWKVKIYDQNGRLYIQAKNKSEERFAQVYILTEEGEKANEEWEADEKFRHMSDHSWRKKLADSRWYTRLPHFAKNVWGRKEN